MSGLAGPDQDRRLIAIRGFWALLSLVSVGGWIWFFLSDSRSANHRSNIEVVEVVLLVVVSGVFLWALLTSVDLSRADLVLLLVSVISVIMLLFSEHYYAYGATAGHGTVDFCLPRPAAGPRCDPIGHTDAVYIAVGNLTTVGLNQVVPETSGARRAVLYQYLFDFVVLGGGLSLVVAKLHGSAGISPGRR